jgi:hypothetical protein
MNKAVALTVGVATITVALFLAAGSSSRDSSPRPEAALVMATVFHQTPSATPTDSATPTLTFTPLPTPTALHLKITQPGSQDILALLFQYPQQGSFIAPRPEVAVDRVRVPDEPHDILIASGNGAAANHLGRIAPVAFGAVLLWVKEEYVVAFRHVEFGRSDARVISWTTPGDPEIWFVFQDVAIEAGNVRTLRRTFVLSCAFGQCKVIESSAGHTS